MMQQIQNISESNYTFGCLQAFPGPLTADKLWLPQPRNCMPVTYNRIFFLLLFFISKLSATLMVQSAGTVMQLFLCLGIRGWKWILFLELQDPDQNKASNPHEKQPQQNPIVCGHREPKSAELHFRYFGPVKKEREQKMVMQPNQSATSLMSHLKIRRSNP